MPAGSVTLACMPCAGTQTMQVRLLCPCNIVGQPPSRCCIHTFIMAHNCPALSKVLFY